MRYHTLCVLSVLKFNVKDVFEREVTEVVGGLEPTVS